MVKMTFKRQMTICAIIILIGVFINAATDFGVISKIMWTISGLLFIINPVPPNASRNVNHIRGIIRIVGGCWIIMAWFLGFTGY